MTKKELLAKITFSKIRNFIPQPLLGKPIPDEEIDYVTSAVIHRIRKVIRAAGRSRVK